MFPRLEPIQEWLSGVLQSFLHEPWHIMSLLSLLGLWPMNQVNPAQTRYTQFRGPGVWHGLRVRCQPLGVLQAGIIPGHFLRLEVACTLNCSSGFRASSGRYHGLTFHYLTCFPPPPLPLSTVRSHLVVRTAPWIKRGRRSLCVAPYRSDHTSSLEKEDVPSCRA